MARTTSTKRAPQGNALATNGRAASVVVRSRGGPHDISIAKLRTRAARMLSSLGRADAELAVMLVDDETMRSLNAGRSLGLRLVVTP